MRIFGQKDCKIFNRNIVQYWTKIGLEDDGIKNRKTAEYSKEGGQNIGKKN
jgi:hypothetical protein